MKNEIKLLDALKQAFPGHTVENIYYAERDCFFVFIDGECVGHFYEAFIKKDFDNPEIEITIKAPLKNLENFANKGSGYGIMRGLVEEGVKKWREESQQNN